MDTHHLTVRHGALTFIYADPLAPLLALGAATVRRVSHVEPVQSVSLRGIGWSATMVDTGVVLGPFPTRQEALDAEIAYLKAGGL